MVLSRCPWRVKEEGVPDLSQVVSRVPPHPPFPPAALARVADQVAGVEPRHDQLPREGPAVRLGQSVGVYPLSPRLRDAALLERE